MKKTTHRGPQTGRAPGGRTSDSGRALLSPQPRPAATPHLLARAVEHHQAGRLAEAEPLYRQILALEPNHADALHLLGLLASQCGQYEIAVELVSRAIQSEPRAAFYHNTLGIAQQRLGRNTEALACYERGLQMQPNQPDTLNNRGVVLHLLGRSAEALQSFELTLTLAPDRPDTLAHLGALLLELGRLDEADLRLRRSLALAPGHADALVALGALLQAQNRIAEAVEVGQVAIAAAPHDPRAHDMLGSALRAAGLMDLAIASYQRALAIDANAAGGWSNLGSALQVAGRTPEAIEAYRRSLALDPDAPRVHSSLIFSLDLTHGAQEEARNERARWNERFGQAWRRRPLAHTNSPDPDRRLRVGYVSGDFFNHSAAFGFMPILRAHDRSQIEMFCYSNGQIVDAITVEARALADRWRDVAYLTDDQLADLIHQDQIDVLVDLSGHSSGNRLPAFARKPAPIQLTGWGYATGTGMDTMDGFLIDRVVVPEHEDDWYAEEIVPLPSVICFVPPAGAPPVNPLPALSRGYLTFGAFNRLTKVSPETRATWAETLRAIPTARLLIKSGGHDAEAARQQLVDDLVAHGVERERIEVRGGSSRLEHLAAHNDVDVLLDSFPHSGGVTTIEAALMGVPVVTLLGEGVAGRLSASYLTALGLGTLVAQTTDAYVEIAQGVAGQLDWLAEQRMTLRERLLASPIGNTEAYTRAVEAAYRGLWRRWRPAERVAAGVQTPDPRNQTARSVSP